jgi:membrane associated rhomboid family serine protease
MPSIHPSHTHTHTHTHTRTTHTHTGKEYIRILTAPYFHVNLLHIAMNMLSFVGIGAYLVSCVVGCLPLLFGNRG